MYEGGRDRDGIEAVEYCDSLFFGACDIGLGRTVCGVPELSDDVIRGGRTGWFGFAAEEGDWEVDGIATVAGGDAADDELVAMVAVMFGRVCVWGRNGGIVEARRTQTILYIKEC